MKILYVEDNEDNVYMLKNRLTRAGYHGHHRHRWRAGRRRWQRASSPT